jgi:hypothetical protein
VSRVYISGPMTGLPEYNFPAFTTAAERLRMMGHEVVSPHEVGHDDNGAPGSILWSAYIRRDLVEMLTCDAIHLLPGWENSRGATLELYVATQVGMTVHIYEDRGR